VLPRGPHGLSREQVEGSQRARLMAAVARLAGEKGYGPTTVGDVARRAGVSLRTFYEHFEDKEQCYLAAYDVFARVLLERIAADVTPVSGWSEFVTAALRAYLGTLAEEPEVARGFLIGANAAGPAARRRRNEAYRAIAQVIKERHAQIRAQDPALGVLPDRAYLGLVHGIRELVADALENQPDEPIEGLAPDIERWITAMVTGAQPER